MKAPTKEHAAKHNKKYSTFSHSSRVVPLTMTSGIYRLSTLSLTRSLLGVSVPIRWKVCTRSSKLSRALNAAFLGVRFLYECVMGLRKHEGHGCILADEM